MILYQLTTDGEMTFSHVSQVFPFLERALRMGRDLTTLPSPRLFKTHLPYSVVGGRPGKYIYVARNGKDVLVSYYFFHKTYLDFTGTFDEFFNKFMAGELQYGSWFQHVAEWRAHSAETNILCLNYEDLCVSIDECLRKIISFCRLTVSPEQYERVKTRSSFSFMKEHESKFDHKTEIAWEIIERRSRDAFLRRGKEGTWREHFSTQQSLMFDQTARLWLGANACV